MTTSPPQGWNVWSLLILLAVVLTVLGLFYQLLGGPLGLREPRWPPHVP